MKPSTTLRQPRIGSSRVDHSNSAPVSTTRKTDSLAIQSSPIQLATRSLSARAVTTSSHSNQTADSERSSTSRPLTSVSRPHRKHKQPHESRKRAEGSKKKVVEPLNFEKGFNIADHLRNSADNDRHGGSTSPDVHQLLQDISSIMRAVSPMHEPSQHAVSPMHEPSQLPPSAKPVSSQQGRGNSDSGQRKQATSSPKQSRKSHLRSRVAANFNLDAAGHESRPDGKLSRAEAAQFSGDIPSGERNKHYHSKIKPKVPHLNISGDSNQPEGKNSPEASLELKGVSGADKEATPSLHDNGSIGGHQGVEDRGCYGDNSQDNVEEPGSEVDDQDHAKRASFRSQEPQTITDGQRNNGMSTL